MDSLTGVGYLITSNMNEYEFFPSQYTYCTRISYRNGPLPCPDVTAGTQTKSEGTFCYVSFTIISVIYLSTCLSSSLLTQNTKVLFLFYIGNVIMCKVCLECHHLFQNIHFFVYSYTCEPQYPSGKINEQFWKLIKM